MSKVTTVSESFGPVLNELKAKLTSMEKIIIYCWLVEMFTNTTDAEVKAQIIQSFGCTSSPLRIVCANVAFGMVLTPLMFVA